MVRVAFLHVGNDVSVPAMLVRSIRITHPDAEIIQCSDHSTPEIVGASKVLRFDGDTSRLMTFRLKCFASVPIEAPTLFLDTDMLMIRPINLTAALCNDEVAVCEREFGSDDLLNPAFGAMDWSEHAGRKVGEVFPLIACATIATDARFWRECLDNLSTLHPKFHVWYGDQEAIRNVADSGRFRVRRLREGEFACPPEFEGSAGNPAILHFKGRRKGLMPGRLWQSMG